MTDALKEMIALVEGFAASDKISKYFEDGEGLKVKNETIAKLYNIADEFEIEQLRERIDSVIANEVAKAFPAMVNLVKEIHEINESDDQYAAWNLNNDFEVALECEGDAWQDELEGLINRFHMYQEVFSRCVEEHKDELRGKVMDEARAKYGFDEDGEAVDYIDDYADVMFDYLEKNDPEYSEHMKMLENEPQVIRDEMTEVFAGLVYDVYDYA